jgi:hypothetical protein
LVIPPPVPGENVNRQHDAEAIALREAWAKAFGRRDGGSETLIFSNLKMTVATIGRVGTHQRASQGPVSSDRTALFCSGRKATRL